MAMAGGMVIPVVAQFIRSSTYGIWFSCFGNSWSGTLGIAVSGEALSAAIADILQP